MHRKGFAADFIYILFPVLLALAISAALVRPLLQPDSIIIEAHQEKAGTFQVFYDIGNGISETDSVRKQPNPINGKILLRIELPFEKLKALRVDPSDNDGPSEVAKLVLKKRGQWVGKRASLESFPLTNGIKSYELQNGHLVINPVAGHKDPFILINQFPELSSGTTPMALKILAAWIIPLGILLASSFVFRSFWETAANKIFGAFGLLFRYFRANNQFSSKSLKKYEGYQHALLLGLILLFLVVSRLINLPLIGSYGDDSHKWLHAKMLVGEIPLSEWHWDHHTARVSIMAATWAVQACFGTEPVWYYLAPFLANVGLLIALYFIGSKVVHPIAGFAACIWTIQWSPFECLLLLLLLYTPAPKY